MAQHLVVFFDRPPNMLTIRDRPGHVGLVVEVELAVAGTQSRGTPGEEVAARIHRSRGKATGCGLPKYVLDMVRTSDTFTKNQ